MHGGKASVEDAQMLPMLQGEKVIWLGEVSGFMMKPPLALHVLVFIGQHDGD